MNKASMPKQLNYKLYQNLKRQLAEAHSGWLTSSSGIEAVCRLARYPFTIRPGNWLTTRPQTGYPSRPAPRCREILFKDSPLMGGQVTVQGLTQNLADDNPLDRVKVSKLPYNYTFGPVHNVAFWRHEGIWQVIVEVKAIFA